MPFDDGTRFAITLSAAVRHGCRPQRPRA